MTRSSASGVAVAVQTARLRVRRGGGQRREAVIGAVHGCCAVEHRPSRSGGVKRNIQTLIRLELAPVHPVLGDTHTHTQYASESYATVSGAGVLSANASRSWTRLGCCNVYDARRPTNDGVGADVTHIIPRYVGAGSLRGIAPYRAIGVRRGLASGVDEARLGICYLRPADVARGAPPLRGSSNQRWRREGNGCG